MLGCVGSAMFGREMLSGGDSMLPENVVSFPVRNPELFSAEINCEILANSEVYRVLYATIRALPYVQDGARRQELKEALCELLLRDGAA